MSATPEIRIGMLGHGAIGIEHAAAFRRLGCELVSVMGPDLSEAAEFAVEYGFTRHTDSAQDVLGDPDVDAVVIASPSASHAAQATAALALGKHVLCEVPLALSLRDFLAVQAARPDHLVCMVCHTQRYLRPVSQLRQKIVDGQLEPLSLVTTMAMYRRKNVGWSGRPRTWTDDLIWHHGTHAVDTALWLLNDEPAQVQAVSGRPHPRTGTPMDLSVAIRTRGGRLATLALSYNALVPVNELVLVAESDTVRVRDWRLLGDPAAEAAPLSTGVHAQASAFIRAVRGEDPGVLRVDDLVAIYRTVDMVANHISRQQA